MERKDIFIIGKTIISMCLFLGIAGFASYSLYAQYSQHDPKNSPVSIEAKDDALRNGLRIINRRRSEIQRNATATADPAIILLDDYTLTTTKPGTSGFD
jgi:hypothetical protein